MQSAGHLDQRSQLREIARAGCGRGRNLTQEPVQLVFFEGEHQPVGIREPKVDAITLMQLAALAALAVDVHSVTAIHIFDKILAVLGRDARVVSRDAIVAEHQMIVALASDQERRSIDHHAASIPRRIGYRQRRRPN